MKLLSRLLCLVGALMIGAPAFAAESSTEFFRSFCLDCHTGATAEGGFDLSTLTTDLGDRTVFTTWVKIHDRVASGEMPPKDSKRPADPERAKLTKQVHADLFAADKARIEREGRTPVRRLTRVEYEHTMRDLLALDGIPLQAGLPEDGSAYNFDKNADALDISHVNLAKYVEAADAALDMAVATQPRPPLRQTHKFSLARHIYHITMNGDAVMLKDGKADTVFPPARRSRMWARTNMA